MRVMRIGRDMRAIQAEVVLCACPTHVAAAAERCYVPVQFMGICQLSATRTMGRRAVVRAATERMVVRVASVAEREQPTRAFGMSELDRVKYIQKAYEEICAACRLRNVQTSSRKGRCA